MKALLQSTLDMVRADIRYVAEAEGQDVWQTYAQAVQDGGDCEDSCWAAYDVLLLKGVPDTEMALLAGTVKLGWGKKPVMHAVLVVGDWVLDILQRTPVRLSRYKMIVEWRLSPAGLFYHGNRFMDRANDPRWKARQEAAA